MSHDYIPHDLDDLNNTNWGILGDTMQYLQEALRWTEGDLQMAKYLLATIAAESGGNPQAAGDYENPQQRQNPKSHGLFQIHDIHGMSVADRQDVGKAFQFIWTQEKAGGTILDWHQRYLQQGYEDGADLATKLLGKMQGSVKQFWGRYGEMYRAVEDALRGVKTDAAAITLAKTQDKREQQRSQQKVRQVLTSGTGKRIRSKKGRIIYPPKNDTWRTTSRA